ncbi:hypothetical protein Tco_1458900 [Tanacetum coccineum]
MSDSRSFSPPKEISSPEGAKTHVESPNPMSTSSSVGSSSRSSMYNGIERSGCLTRDGRGGMVFGGGRGGLGGLWCLWWLVLLLVVRGFWWLGIGYGVEVVWGGSGGVFLEWKSGSHGVYNWAGSWRRERGVGVYAERWWGVVGGIKGVDCGPALCRVVGCEFGRVIVVGKRVASSVGGNL